MNEIQQLRNKLSKLSLPYLAAGMIEADESLQVLGRAFFPVGRGLWEKNEESLSSKRIMVLGQDFGTVEDVKTKVLPKGEENIKGNPTWNNLISLLKASVVEPEDCFFTNAIMGLRLEGKNTDTPSAFKNPEFLNACRLFFIEQLKVQKPQLVLALGFWPVRFLRENFSPQLTQKWISAKNITPIVADEKLAVARNIQFDGIPDWTTNIVVLFHPSLRGVNVAKLSKQDSLNFNINTESERIRSILH